MKRLVYNKWYGWMSNDPNLWWVWVVNYAEWVELRENSKKIKLSKWSYYNQYLTSSDKVIWYNYYNWSNFLRLHSSWKITNIFKNDIDNSIYVTDLDWSWYNIWEITTPITKYWFAITSTKLYQWVYQSSYASLWIYDDLSSWIISNWDFSSSTGWTIWAGWTISWWLATHTAWWWSDSLSYTTNTLAWDTYRMEVLCWTITSDSCQLRIWWVNKYTFTSSDSWKTVIFNYTALADNEVVEFAPFTWFAWSFDSIEWKQLNLTSYSKVFNEKAPYIIMSNLLLIWNWNKITEVDTTLSTWVLTDVLTIDLDYIIKGITRIGDQFFIYASNWSTTRQYLWDWISTAITWVITWVDKNCVNVANWANQDYIITSSSSSNRTWLWLVNWYQLQNIFINTENTNSSNERIYFESNYINAIETIWNRLLIPWIKWLYTYWQYTPWFPYALVKEYIHLWWVVSAMSYNESNSNRIVYSYTWTINGVSWVYEDVIQITQWYNLRTDMSWFIVFPPISWECISNIKSLEKITIWWKIVSWTKINVYTRNDDRTIKYANVPYADTTLPTVWAIYTFDWNTYTVYAVTDMTWYCILHCTYTWTWTWTVWTFTKTSWTWDSSFYCEKVRYWYKLVWSATNINKRRHSMNAQECAEQYYELYPAIELLTSSTSLSPEFSDINLYFNETTDD